MLAEARVYMGNPHSITHLKKKLEEAVERNLGEGLLLSGGLDSSILAFLAPGVKGFTVALELYGSDLKYAKTVAEFLNIELEKRIFSVEEALEDVPKVIKILRTFDPAIPNDIAIYFGLALGKEYGVNSMMTGDGGDELFAGYEYMHDLDLDDYIPEIAQTMRFSSNDLGKSLGVEIKQPYLEREFVEFALGIGADLKVRRDGGKRWGKWILRKAFENDLPKEIVWRDKAAIEFGSGTTNLRRIIESRISDAEFKQKAQSYPVRFRNKEHLFYYEIYRTVVGEIPEPEVGERECSECGAGVRGSHCRVCGGFPV